MPCYVYGWWLRKDVLCSKSPMITVSTINQNDFIVTKTKHKRSNHNFLKPCDKKINYLSYLPKNNIYRANFLWAFKTITYPTLAQVEIMATIKSTIYFSIRLVLGCPSFLLFLLFFYNCSSIINSRSIKAQWAMCWLNDH